jgi:hypothetical protein
MTALAQAMYVFGVVPADASLGELAEQTGTELVVAGPVAAVVGSLAPGATLGADDLRRHDRVVAALVEQHIPVLPMRFGIAVADADAVVADVLEPNADTYAAALAELTGLVQFTVQVRYERTGVLREIVADNPEVAAARIAAAEPAASTATKLRLGELVVAAIGRRRSADAERIRAAVAPAARDVHVTLAEDPDSVGQLACLVAADDSERFIDLLEGLARDNAAVLRLRLLGPLAPYDFVPGG